MRDQTQKRAFAEEALSEAKALSLAGRTQAARDKLQAILSVWPAHEAANIAMAELLTPSGNARELSALQNAALKTNDPNAWSRYVFELRMAGQKNKARKAAEKAKVNATQRKALKQIAEGRSAPIEDILQLINQGSNNTAWSLGAKRQKHFPGDHRLLNLLGVAALADENATRAEAVLRQSLKLAPDYEPARVNLAFALLTQNRALDVIALLEESATQKDASIDIRANLASAYLKIEQLQKADDLSRCLYAEKPEDTEIIGIRCKTLIARGKASEAMSILNAQSLQEGFALQDVLASAIIEAEGKPAALAYIGKLDKVPQETDLRLVAFLAKWGALKEAVSRAREMAEQAPTNPAPFRLAGLLAKWKPNDPLVGTMAKNAENPGLSQLKQGTFALAHAKALMDLKDHDAAMIALNNGNAALRSQIDYSVADDEKLMERIASCWSAQAIEEAKTSLTDPNPIFIIGLPRSGSTLWETILSCHPEVDSKGETPVAFIEATKARLTATSKAVANVAEALRGPMTPPEGKQVVTDKLLSNFLNVGVLAAAFPGARFVGMKRDYRATCFSIYSADLEVAAHSYAMNLEELARYAVAQHTLMRHWQSILGSRFVSVDYEKLVASPDLEIPDLLQKLDLRPHDACLHPEKSERHIDTMSVGQARKPISTGSIERWKLYEAGLKPLSQILERNGLI